MSFWRWLPVLLLACAAQKALQVPHLAKQQALSKAPSLPARLNGVVARELPLAPTERQLSAAGRVQLERKAYRTTQVALVTSTGLKELHPPTSCLKSEGFEVIRQKEVKSAAGCLNQLTVRDRDTGEEQSFIYTYRSPDAVTCSLWRRAAAASWGLIRGAPVPWSSVQAMDRDPERARQTVVRLLYQLSAGPASHNPHPRSS